MDGVDPKAKQGPGQSSGLARDPEEFGEECGGEGGVPYQVAAQTPERIIRVTLWHRRFVDGIQLETDQRVLPKIGGTGQHHDIQMDTFTLESDEVLTGISIEYWTYLDRITIHTNKRNYGPYGGTGGRLKRSLSAPAGRAVAGFKGRHWELIDSIQLMIF